MPRGRKDPAASIIFQFTLTDFLPSGMAYVKPRENKQHALNPVYIFWTTEENIRKIYLGLLFEKLTVESFTFAD